MLLARVHSLVHSDDVAQTDMNDKSTKDTLSGAISLRHSTGLLGEYAGTGRLWDLATGCMSVTAYYLSRDILGNTDQDVADRARADVLTRVAALRHSIRLPGGHAKKSRLWDLTSLRIQVTEYHLDRGFLLTTPPDISGGAPSGWLWTDRPDLVRLTESDLSASGGRKSIPRNDKRFRKYMLAYNRPDVVMAWIYDPQRYKELTGRMEFVRRHRQRQTNQHRPVGLRPGHTGGDERRNPPYVRPRLADRSRGMGIRCRPEATRARRYTGNS
jgi:hypothetical protein